MFVFCHNHKLTVLVITEIIFNVFVTVNTPLCESSLIEIILFMSKFKYCCYLLISKLTGLQLKNRKQ